MAVYRCVERGLRTLDHPTEEDSQATETYHNVGGKGVWFKDSVPVPPEKQAAKNARLKKMGEQRYTPAKKEEAASDENSWGSCVWKECNL